MKRLFLFIFIQCIIRFSYGQLVCAHEVGQTMDTKRSGSIVNGDVFTPRGDLRVLIVFISYGPTFDTLEVDSWPVGSEFPNWVLDTSRKAFYNDFSEFSQDIYSDNNRYSVSNFFYQMSQGTFRLVADYYPKKIVVNVDKTDRWEDIHKKALMQIPSDFNWSKYDNRKNKPSFKYDNSTSSPDKNIDYIVFCHRFSNNWDTLPSTKLSYIFANGFSSSSISNYEVANGYCVKNDGYTQITGGFDPIKIFPHELGHSLYDGPHYSGGNSVCGEYFYMPLSGWGMMNIDKGYSSAIGWERYILDWISEIKANNIDTDIDSKEDLFVTGGIFKLRDFITTGDAIRIKIPSLENNQYLWIENHQCISTYDGNINGSHFCNSEIDEFKKGIVAYVESYSGAKDANSFNLFSNGNGIRWLSKVGNYDFSFRSNVITPDELCNNVTYPFYIGKENPIGGQNIGESIRQDFDNDGSITYSTGMNTANNEYIYVVQLDDKNPTPKYITGTGMHFQVGDKVSISTNPCIVNLPKYDSKSYKMGDYFLNGISFELLSQDVDGSINVKIKLDDVDVDKNTRWAGSSILLSNITNDSLADIKIKPNVLVEIDMSGTPNRHKNPANLEQSSSNVLDFISPTVFTCRDGSYFKQEAHSMVNVINNSTLVLDSGSVYEVNDNAVLNIEQSGTLIVKAGATLRVKGRGYVDVKNGGYICVENGAIINLVDTLSMVNLRMGSQIGLNNGVNTSMGCSCITSANSITSVGNGVINSNFNTNRCIQNITYTMDAVETGNNINAGYDVCDPSYGDVIIQNNADVIIDGEGDVLLKNGIEVKYGSSLEIR